MSEVEDYRRRLEEEIDRERAPAPGDGLLGAVSGETGGTDDIDADPDVAVAPALRVLADPHEKTDARRGALIELKRASFSSPTSDSWRPDFNEALRQCATADDEQLRLEALEVLAAARDPWAEQLLVDGVRDPGRAVIPVEDALALLSIDAHADSREAAAAIADDPPSERARMEALHVLAADAASAGRFRSLFTDRGEATHVRQLAATALSSLDRDAFRAAAAEVVEGDAGGADEVELLGAGGDDELRAHTRALLDLDE